MRGLNTIRRAVIKTTLLLSAFTGISALPVAAEEFAEKEELKFGFINLTDIDHWRLPTKNAFLKTEVCT